MNYSAQQYRDSDTGRYRYPDIAAPRALSIFPRAMVLKRQSKWLLV